MMQMASIPSPAVRQTIASATDKSLISWRLSLYHVKFMHDNDIHVEHDHYGFKRLQIDQAEIKKNATNRKDMKGKWKTRGLQQTPKHHQVPHRSIPQVTFYE